MKNNIKLSVIIAYYKNIDFLELVLLSLENQTIKNFEVIIAEDADDDETKNFLNKCNYSFKISHVYQEDIGWRKNKILNSAIRISKADFLLFIDGDCILHRKFIEEYSKRTQKELCLFGDRVQLDAKITRKLIETKDLSNLLILKILFSKSTSRSQGIYIPFIKSKRKLYVNGSSFCVSRKKMYEINGFDEDFINPTCGEDVDIQRRLILLGAKFKSVEHKAIQYHLYYTQKERKESIEKSGSLFEKKFQNENYRCKNGLIK